MTPLRVFVEQLETAWVENSGVVQWFHLAVWTCCTEESKQYQKKWYAKVYSEKNCNFLGLMCDIIKAMQQKKNSMEYSWDYCFNYKAQPKQLCFIVKVVLC